jgi:hypothetical protein
MLLKKKKSAVNIYALTRENFSLNIIPLLIYLKEHAIEYFLYEDVVGY